MATQAEIEYELKIKNLKQELKRTEGAFKSWGMRTAKMIGGILAGGLAFGGAEYVGIQKSLRQVRMLSDKIDISALKELSDEIEGTFGIEQKDTINAFYQAISAGNSEENSRKILKVATALASVGAAAGDTIDVKGAMDGLTSVVNAFGMSAEEASGAADMMMASIVQGKTSINEMAHSLGSVAPIANSLGIHLIDILAPLDALTAQGMSTDESMTAIRQIMVSMLKPTADLQSKIEELGYSTGSQMLQSLGLAGTLKTLGESVDGVNVQWADYFANVRALSGVAGLAGTEKAMAKLMEMQEKLKASTGTLGDKTKLFLDDPATKWTAGIKKMKSIVVDLIDGVGGLGNAVTILMSLFAAFKVGSMVMKLIELATAYSALAVAKTGAESGPASVFTIPAVVGAIAAGMAAVGIAKIGTTLGAGSGGGAAGAYTPQKSSVTTVIHVSGGASVDSVRSNGGTHNVRAAQGRGE